MREVDLTQPTHIQCSGCKKTLNSSLKGVMDWARVHHDKFDHPPYKPSTEPDIHFNFIARIGGRTFEIQASAMFVRLFEGRELIHMERYAAINSVEGE